jgi:hypothetical protein
MVRMVCCYATREHDPHGAHSAPHVAVHVAGHHHGAPSLAHSPPKVKVLTVFVQFWMPDSCQRLADPRLR